MHFFAENRKLRIFLRSLFYFFLVIILGSFTFVFFWMVFNSFKTRVDLEAYPPIWVFNPTLINFRNVFSQTPFFHHTINSLIIGLAAVFFGMLFGLPAAYSIARYKHRYLALSILTTRMVPGICFLVPWFIIFRKLGLLDTYFALITTHLVITLPLITWIMIGFFEDIPEELEESARIDGCTRWGAFFRIALPLTKPGIATTGILSLIFSWNHFLFALVLAGPNTNTLPVVVFNFMDYEELDMGGIYAAATCITFPVLFMALMIQKQFVRGLTLGGVKE
ncbi:MAG: carbohydrate ABC transporter permease [Deltaproteobacteria bacterium]|nr:carbohydrate ABC transporter permease [Deltaproteobacteria bacterium]MBW2153737.1 carbohydrate ABC transporter permease [Deltaproteobacteria bacterium]